MKNTKSFFDWHENAGLIGNGPSRENMFDSLRLGLPVEFSFFSTKGFLITFREVYVVDIKRSNRIFPPLFSDEENWIISLSIFKSVERRGKKKYQFIGTWEGNYSTRSRDGEFFKPMPDFLINKI